MKTHWLKTIAVAFVIAGCTVPSSASTPEQPQKETQGRDTHEADSDPQLSRQLPTHNITVDPTYELGNGPRLEPLTDGEHSTGGIVTPLVFKDVPLKGAYLVTAYSSNSTAFKYEPFRGWRYNRELDLDSSFKTAWTATRFVTGELSNTNLRSRSWPDGISAISLDGLRGTSAGMVMTLALLEAHTGLDITGGLKVAGSGTINAEGMVGVIAGLDQKYTASRIVGPDVFFSAVLVRPRLLGPNDQIANLSSDFYRREEGVSGYLQLDKYLHAGAQHKEGNGTTVVRIGDIRQAIAWLCGAGAFDACILTDRISRMELSDIRTAVE